MYFWVITKKEMRNMGNNTNWGAIGSGESSIWEKGPLGIRRNLDTKHLGGEVPGRGGEGSPYLTVRGLKKIAGKKLKPLHSSCKRKKPQQS